MLCIKRNSSETHYVVNSTTKFQATLFCREIPVIGIRWTKLKTTPRKCSTKWTPKFKSQPQVFTVGRVIMQLSSSYKLIPTLVSKNKWHQDYKRALYYNKNIILQILVTRQNNQTLTQEDWKDCIEFSALWSCSGTLPVLLKFLSDWFLFEFTTWGFVCEGVEISSPNFASNFLPTISQQYEQFWTSITKLWSTSLRKNVHKKIPATVDSSQRFDPDF